MKLFFIYCAFAFLVFPLIRFAILDSDKGGILLYEGPVGVRQGFVLSIITDVNAG